MGYYYGHGTAEESARVAAAAREAGSQDPEAIAAAAAKYNVDAQAIVNLRAATVGMDKTPENYVSSPNEARPNTEVKYYRNGKPVYGNVNETVVIPPGASAPRPTTRQEFEASLLQRQGKQGVMTTEGEVRYYENERRKVITPNQVIVDVPASAHVNSAMVEDYVQQQMRRQKEAESKVSEEAPNVTKGLNTIPDSQLRPEVVQAVKDPYGNKLLDTGGENNRERGIYPPSNKSGPMGPQNVLQNVQAWYDIKGRESELQAKKLGSGPYSLILSSGTAFLFPFFHPIKYAGGIVGMFVHPVKYLEETYQQFVTTPWSAAGGVIGGVVFGKLTMPIIEKPVQYLRAKTSPNYVAYESSGVAVVEGVTIPRTLAELEAMEGKTVPVAHATMQPGLQLGSEIVPAAMENLAGWRKELGQRSLYTSSPEPAMIEKQIGSRYSPERTWEMANYENTPIAPKYQPVVYGGYIDIGTAGSESVRYQLSLLPPNRRAFIFRETEITPTPPEIKAQSAKDIIAYQSKNAGTYVPGENIKGMSTEGQFTTSPGIEGEPLVQVKPVEGPLAGKWTYYNQLTPFPEWIGKSPKTMLVNDMIKNPEAYLTKGFAGRIPKLDSDMQIVLKELYGEDVVITGGLARRIATGKGKVRDIDIITDKGEQLARQISEKYPDRFVMMQHPEIKTIFRIGRKSDNKPFVDFDPISIAEEGLYAKSQDKVVEVEGYKVVRPEILLKSKAMQFKKGKVEKHGKQYGQVEELTGIKNIHETLQQNKPEVNRHVQGAWDFLTSRNTKINFIEAKMEIIKEKSSSTTIKPATAAPVTTAATAATDLKTQAIKSAYPSEAVLGGAGAPFLSPSKSLPGKSSAFKLDGQRVLPESKPLETSRLSDSFVIVSSPAVSYEISSEKSSAMESSSSIGSSGSTSSSGASPTPGSSPTSYSLGSSSPSGNSPSTGGSSGSSSGRIGSGSSGSGGASSIPFGDDEEEPEEEGIFTAMVKRHGLFMEIGRSRSLKEASMMMAAVVDFGAGASGRVMGPFGVPVEAQDVMMNIPTERFRPSKIEPDLIVEKSKYRISASGERFEITEQGLAAIRNRGRLAWSI